MTAGPGHVPGRNMADPLGNAGSGRERVLGSLRAEDRRFFERRLASFVPDRVVDAAELLGVQ